MPEVRERGRTNYVREKFKRHTKVQVQEMRKDLHNGQTAAAVSGRSKGASDKSILIGS